MRKVASTGSVEERLRRLEQAWNFQEYVVAVTAVTDDVTTVAGGGGTTGFVYEVPVGTIDGANATFMLTAAPGGGDLLLWKNGKFQSPGASKDYVVTGTTVTYNAGNLPQSGDAHFAAYETVQTLLYEVPAGAVDGANDTFTLTATPDAPTILLWKRGLFQIAGAGIDYTRSGTTVVFAAGNLPQSGDNLFTAYEPP